MFIGQVPSGLDFNAVLQQEKAKERQRQVQGHRQRRMSDSTVRCSTYIAIATSKTDYSNTHRLDQEQTIIKINTNTKNHLNNGMGLDQVYKLKHNNNNVMMS